MKSTYLIRIPFLYCLSTLLMCGCAESGPEIASVTGVITLNEQPLSQAEVMFVPDGNGRTSTGVTDNTGYYELQYTATQSGAIVGSHTVRITTAQPEYADEATNTFHQAVPEKLPEKYHSKSILVAEIQSGSNTVNLELSSD